MSNGQFLDWAFQYRGIQFELLSLLSIAKLLHHSHHIK